ncbi:MAG: chromosome segregation protein SMC [Lachnospiraceae bacterium]
MYLKSIEVQGFKSFANKIVFDFHNGITGIVGPNGSGKSNVADAVRWVLGEQRIKQLRGGTMQDVIFSGTESRKPLSYASVAITLDNSDHQLPIDYEEVTVARKIYRSGESDYLINGTACRLKDVNELFYDTGIGKEGYSIIGQGQIDRILSGKPEEKRELFDEAAGIVKFKRRKNMSVKKLEDEQANLIRINDILSELEKQVGPLEKQSTVAKEYLKKREELRNYDINMFLLETQRLKKETEQIQALISNAQKELEEANTAYNNTKEEYETIEDQVDEIDASIGKSKNQLNETALLKQQLESKIQVLKEQINTARMNDEHYAKRLKAIQLEISERKKQESQLKQESAAMQHQLEEATSKRELDKTQLLEMQEKLIILATSVERYQSEILDLLNNRASTKANIQKYNTLFEQMQVRKVTLNQKLIEMKSGTNEKRTSIENFETDLENISIEITAFLQEMSQFESEIQILQKELQKQTDLLRIGQTAYHREQSRLESLKNITERYDGYGNSIRKVMEKKEQEPGLLGVVADIIKVDKTYEIAIETALGGSIQNIVTTDEHTAKRMVQYLKENKLGRATFLPLTSMNGGTGIRQQDALKENGVIGLANTLVKVHDKYRGLADSLLGRTIVVQQIDHGIALAKKYNHSLRIVTIEGELMNPGGSITGGAFKNSSNLLSRRREIEEFEKSVLLLKKDMDLMELEVEKGKDKRTQIYTKMEEVKQKLQHAYVVQNTAKMNLNQVTEKQEEEKLKYHKIQQESMELEHQLADIMENQGSIQIELETSEELEKNLNNKISQGQSVLEEERKNETKKRELLEAQHLKLANLEQKNIFILENKKRILDEIDKFEEELISLEQNKGSSSEEITEKEQEITNIYCTIEDSKELFEEIESEIQKSVHQKEELNLKFKQFLNKREELSKHISDLDKESYRLKSKHEIFEESCEKQYNYMWEEYELTFNHALELRDENLTDANFMKKQIQNLKTDIKNLGAVNVNAIEEYKELSERYNFLKGQHDDLIEAEQTLQQIIEELDEAMRKQFRERFDEISKEFDVVFQQLFGGGKGTLELMEDEDVLEASIRIIAQPPGKKLQNMMQLSGGEKALTAIAILFAIQNLKPSPFCLLDEIEATLDDSNVERFAKYLHKLTKYTQFIVITHRRGTMTAADRLYGITMQEKGISTLVSVDLLESELT